MWRWRLSPGVDWVARHSDAGESLLHMRSQLWEHAAPMTQQTAAVYDLLVRKGLARSFTDLHHLMHALQNITMYSPPGARSEYRFFWRGQRDASWGLEPKLFRNLREKLGREPTVAEFNAREDEILDAFARTELGKDNHVLENLALLQHHGAPTRLLDVSTDFLPALYFACEDGAGISRTDGLILAFLASAAQGDLKPDRGSTPNIGMVRTQLRGGARYYQPRPVSERIRNQRAAFIVSAVPTDTMKGALAIEWALPETPWKATTLDKVLLPPGQWAVGKPARPVILGLRVASQLKPQILSYLDRVFRLNPNTIYPDIQGFVATLTNG